MRSAFHYFVSCKLRHAPTLFYIYNSAEGMICQSFHLLSYFYCALKIWLVILFRFKRLYFKSCSIWRQVVNSSCTKTQAETSQVVQYCHHLTSVWSLVLDQKCNKIGANPQMLYKGKIVKYDIKSTCILICHLHLSGFFPWEFLPLLPDICLTWSSILTCVNHYTVFHVTFYFWKKRKLV
jgi:hypothetical protein